MPLPAVQHHSCLHKSKSWHCHIVNLLLTLQLKHLLCLSCPPGLQAELLNREKLFERFIATQTLRLQPQVCATQKLPCTSLSHPASLCEQPCRNANQHSQADDEALHTRLCPQGSSCAAVLLQNFGLHVCEGAMSAFRADPSVKGIAAAALADCTPEACSAGPGGCEEILPMRKIWASSGWNRLRQRHVQSASLAAAASVMGQCPAACL